MTRCDAAKEEEQQDKGKKGRESQRLPSQLQQKFCRTKFPEAPVPISSDAQETHFIASRSARQKRRKKKKTRVRSDNHFKWSRVSSSSGRLKRFPMLARGIFNRALSFKSSTTITTPLYPASLIRCPVDKGTRGPAKRRLVPLCNANSTAHAVCNFLSSDVP